MKLLTQDELEKWLAVNGLTINGDKYLRYREDESHSVTLSLEDKPSRIIALADHLVPTWPDEPFDGALFWIRERGAWDDFSKDVGEVLLRKMRTEHGVSASLEEKPGWLFSSDEIKEMHACLLLPMLFGWDAFLALANKDYFLFVSHDGVVEVVGRTDSALEAVQSRVASWKPKSDRHWYSQLACR